MYKLNLNILQNSRFFMVLIYLSVNLTGFFLINNKVLSNEKPSISYDLNFTPPNLGTSEGNGTQKPRKVAARALGNLQALIPWTKADPDLQRPIYESVTSEAHPTFWLFYEGELNSETPIEISLEIKNTTTSGETYFYQHTFESVYESNLLHLELPPDAPPLITGSTYQWRFIASQDGKVVGEAAGSIERITIPSETSQQLLTVEATQKLEIYAQWGAWHELLDTLIQLRENNPDDSDLKNAWNNLFRENNNQIYLLMDADELVRQLELIN